MGFRAGIDWGGSHHAACAVDEASGAVVARFAVEHTSAGLDELARRLARFGPAAALPVAVERPSGLLVEAPLAAGHPVGPIHPNAVKATRPRHRAAGLFADIDSPIALAFLRRYPTPASAARLGEARMAAFLRKQRYCGRRSPAELLARLRAAPPCRAGEAEARAKGELVGVLVSLLEALGTRIAELTARIEQAAADLPDGKVIMSFPRAGRVCAAQILAELGDVRERFQTADQLAAEAGVCPVTRQSGKSRGVVFRRACNRHLRRAITCFAHNSRYPSAWAAAIYDRARERGCDHPHAIRVLARAWIRILWRAWMDRRPYDPELHAAAT